MPDARELQQLRRVDRAAAEHHVAGDRPLRRRVPPLRVLHADRARAVEQDLRHERAGLDVEVRPRPHRVQVGAGRGEAAPPVHVAVERREPLLPVAVHVVGERIARLLHRLEERAEQRARRGPALEHERTRVAAELVGPLGREAAFHALEVGEAVRVVPRLHAGVRRPSLVVERVPSLEDHAVDAARAAEHLAASVVDAPAVHVRLGLALVLPVVERAADRERQRRRHVDEDVPDVVGPPGLEHEHPVRGVRGQPVGERAAGGAAADDDEVVPPAHGEPPRSRARRREHAPHRAGPAPRPLPITQPCRLPAARPVRRTPGRVRPCHVSSSARRSPGSARAGSCPTRRSPCEGGSIVEVGRVRARGRDRRADRRRRVPDAGRRRPPRAHRARRSGGDRATRA